MRMFETLIMNKSIVRLFCSSQILLITYSFTRMTMGNFWNNVRIKVKEESPLGPFENCCFMIRAVLFVFSLPNICKMFMNSICKSFLLLGKSMAWLCFYIELLQHLSIKILLQNVLAYTISMRLQKVCDEGRPAFVLTIWDMHPASSLYWLLTRKVKQ